MSDEWDRSRLRDMDWAEEAKGILKAEMKRRNVTYGTLRDRLAEMGIEESEANLRNKVSRGSFTAGFFLQCMVALGVYAIDIRSLYEPMFDIAPPFNWNR